MIIGTIKQQHDRLFTDVNSVANQYSDCLQLLVDFTDNYFDGYTLTWLYSSDRDMQKTSKLNYNVANKLLTLPYEALKKDGSIFISVKAYWRGVTITSRPVCFYISKTLNTDATDIPREPGWEETVEGMLDQMLGLEIKGEISNQLPEAIANAPVKSHTHDERYYTEAEVNQLLSKKADSLNIKQLSNPNLLINGNFQIFQRGTLFDIKSTQITADRWMAYYDTNNGGFTITCEAGKIIIQPNSLGKICGLYQIIELDNALIDQIKGQQLTLSFKALSTTRKTFNTEIVILRNSGSSISFGKKQYTLEENTETVVTSTINIPSTTNFDSCKGLQVVLINDFISSGTKVTYLWAKLEIGGFATQIMPRIPGEELRLCYRYYQKADTSMTVINNFGSYLRFIVPMRSAPTFSIENEKFGFDGDTATDGAGIVVFENHPDALVVANTVANGILWYRCSYIVDAEIY